MAKSFIEKRYYITIFNFITKKRRRISWRWFDKNVKMW